MHGDLMKKPKSLKAKTKILCAVLIPFFIVAIATIATILQRNVLQEKIGTSRMAVNAAFAVFEEYHALAQQGTLTLEDAQARAASAIGRLRYDADRVFWIFDSVPTMIVHPQRPELEGTALGRFQDARGSRAGK